MGVQRNGGTATATRSAKTYAPPAEEPTEGLEPEDEEAMVDRSSSVVKRGWGAAKAKIKETGFKGYADDWSPPEGVVLGKFLEDEPFAVVGQHWVNEMPQGEKKSWNCREDDCPLCGVGNEPRALVYFNFVPILVNGETVEPQVVALKATPKLEGYIEKASDSDRGPLSRHYWLIHRWEEQKGKQKPKVDYKLESRKATDLAEDFELDPVAVAGALEGLELFQPDIVPIPTRKVLEDIVVTHLSND